MATALFGALRETLAQMKKEAKEMVDRFLENFVRIKRILKK
jgi:hypothetical protein